MSSWKDADAVCPFYQRTGREKGSGLFFITCEGPAEAEAVKLGYRAARARDKQKRLFCDSCFPCCEVYRAILDKYPD